MLHSLPRRPVQSAYYIGDPPAVSRPLLQKGKRIDMPVVIDGLELKRLTQKLDGGEASEKLRQMLNEDRNERHKLSKARVKNWDNTFSGQRRKRLAARNERLEIEEAARIEADKMFKAEEIASREQAIQRAKNLQYVENDLVKAFHSRVMLFQVLQERDLQVQLNNERKGAGAIDDDKHWKETAARLEAEIQAEDKLQKDAKLRSIQIAKDQLAQQKMNAIRAYNERKTALEEGQRLATADREYQQKQKEIERKRREGTVMFRKQLQELREQIKDNETKQRQENEAEDQRIEAWVSRKNQQTQLKKELETKWFNDALDVRQQLGEMQLRITSDADAKIEEQIKLRILERDSKSKKEEQERFERKKKNHAELRRFFHDYLRQAEERRQKQKEEDQRTLNEYLRIRDETNAQKEAYRVAQLQSGKSLQAFHLKQIEQNAENRSKEKTQRMSESNARRQTAETEEQALVEYMKQVSQEPWAVKNRRLQTFMRDELSRPRGRHGGGGNGSVAANAARAQSRQNTTNRLGFANEGYSKTDLARTNEVTAGDFLTMVGESSFK